MGLIGVCEFMESRSSILRGPSVAIQKKHLCSSVFIGGLKFLGHRRASAVSSLRWIGVVWRVCLRQSSAGMLRMRSALVAGLIVSSIPLTAVAPPGDAVRRDVVGVALPLGRLRCKICRG